MIINRRIIVLPALAALAGHHAQAFTPTTLGRTGSAASSISRFSMLATDADVSIDYDAPARLAYDKWCAKYGKEASDAKFETFKANYEALTVANVVAAKKSRDDGTERPKDLELNEFGDMTEAEYMAMKSGGAPDSQIKAEPEMTPEKGPLETVMEASAAQSEASSALAEAADALAEEEQKLAEQLGMGSIEELENAIDAMEGIDTDGGEIDTSDVREARVRSAYLDWCKEYGKQPDESRFPTFSSNFLAMEDYAKENGREMVLNKYADCTEEEYRKLTEAPAPKIEIEETVVEQKIEVDAKETTLEKKIEDLKVVEDATEGKPPKVEADAEPAVAKAKAAPKPAAKPKPEPFKELSLEEQAIADAKAAAEKEAAQVARRRALDEAAAEMERQKAKEAMEKQQKLKEAMSASFPKPPTPDPVKSQSVATYVKPVTKKPEPPASVPKKSVDGGIFASIFGNSSKPVEKKAAIKPVATVKPIAPIVGNEEEKPDVKKEPSSPFAALFQSPVKPEPKVEPKVETVEAPKVTPPKKSVDDINIAPNAMTEALNSFFGTSQSTPSTPPVSTPEPEPAAEDKSTFAAFNFFGGSPAPKKAGPVAPKPAPVPVRKPSPTLSLFNTAPKPAPKVTSPSPVEKLTPKGSGTFSLFSSPPAPKPAPATETVVEKKPASSFGFFGAAPKPALTPDPEPAVEKTIAQGSGTFSLFGGAAPKPAPPAKAPAVEKTEVTKASNPFGLFSTSPNKSTPPKKFTTPKKSTPVRGPGTFSISPSTSIKAKSPAPKPVPQSPTFNIFGGSKPSSPAPAPTPTPAAPKPVTKKTSSFSFSGKAISKKEAVVPKKPAQKSPTFNIFGGASPAKKPEATPTPEPATVKAASKPTFGFSFGGGSPKATATKTQSPVVDNIPIVSKFKQNADGSITGIVRNSKNFRNGTEITTSPVRRGAKSGDIVTTSSGSKYRLE